MFDTDAIGIELANGFASSLIFLTSEHNLLATSIFTDPFAPSAESSIRAAILVHSCSCFMIGVCDPDLGRVIVWAGLRNHEIDLPEHCPYDS